MTGPETDQRRRDAQVARVLGGFLCVIALPVLAGIFFATLAVDRWINAVAGLVLLGIGAGFVARSRRS
ncbi:MAG TPA: hypothetical protein VMT85_18570 [Thermoanaerobaculia bacterium]|nr:hypothetical protein [Thermoanaerobaculia bacterium]